MTLIEYNLYPLSLDADYTMLESSAYLSGSSSKLCIQWEGGGVFIPIISLAYIFIDGYLTIAVDLKLYCSSEAPRGLLKHRLLVPNHRVPDLEGLV